MATILPVLAKRMQFDSQLLDLQFLEPSNQPIREPGPLSTNQILDPLDLGTLKSANHRAGITFNQSHFGSSGKVGPEENPTSRTVKIASQWV